MKCAVDSSSVVGVGGLERNVGRCETRQWILTNRIRRTKTKWKRGEEAGVIIYHSGNDLLMIST